MDATFVELLNSQAQKFRRAIMRDYWDYRRSAPITSGFTCLELSTKEYQLLKYFEVRLEEYVRRYLLNGFFGRILECRGNGVYPPEVSSKIDSEKHYLTTEYEEIAGYEFIVDSFPAIGSHRYQ